MWKFIHRKKKTPSSKGSLAENAVAGGSFSVLPDEILLFVFSFLDIKSLVSVSMVDQRPTLLPLMGIKCVNCGNVVKTS